MRIWLGICATCVLAVGLAPLAAQDVAGVSPETHKLLLDNEHARVFDVRVKPGERVGMHTHPAGVVYFMSDAKLRITYPDGAGGAHGARRHGRVDRWRDARGAERGQHRVP